MIRVFYSILPIFLIALLGSIIRRKWIKSDEFWRGLEKLSFYILFPCVLFEHTSGADTSRGNLPQLIMALTISISIISLGLILYPGSASIVFWHHFID